STGTLGMAAALAVSEASIYGGGNYTRAVRFLVFAREHVAAGGDLAECVHQELKRNRSMAGYGRPLVNGDERNPHILALAEELELDQGVYLRMALEIEQILLASRMRIKMNYVGLSAALVADMSFSPREFYLFAFPAFLAGMPPGFIEASERTEGTLYPLACDDVLYEGESCRPWLKSGNDVPI
ncbi:MAG: hypothetical protein PHF75_07410, partial [Gallionella sp.]|nr:hypothetical protein [Gallionella sp.]